MLRIINNATLLTNLCNNEDGRDPTQSQNVTLNYFLFFTCSGWLIFETLQSVESAQTIANTLDEFATFADSYFKEDVESFDEPYTLIKI
jgi:hypothetical protein